MGFFDEIKKGVNKIGRQIKRSAKDVEGWVSDAWDYVEDNPENLIFPPLAATDLVTAGINEGLGELFPQPELPELPELPEPPEPPEVDDDVGAEQERRRRVGRQQTILTRPRYSALSEAPVVRPTLLGQ